MMKFIIFNMLIGLINVLILYIFTKKNQIKVVKPCKLIDKIKFLFNDIKIYLLLFLGFSIPIFNIIILFITLKEVILNND